MIGSDDDRDGDTAAADGDRGVGGDSNDHNHCGGRTSPFKLLPSYVLNQY